MNLSRANARDLTHMPSIHQHLKSYLNNLSEKGTDKDTIRNYSFYLKRFLKQSDISEPEQITTEVVEWFRTYLAAQRNRRGGLMRQSTQNYHLIALRSFIEFLRQQNLTLLNPNTVKLKKADASKKTSLEKTDLERLLEAPMQMKRVGIIQQRDRALLELLFTTGLKVSEVAKLTRGDINVNENTIAIHGTSGRVRGVPLTSQTRYWIKEYLTMRTDRFPALFIRHDKAKKKQLETIEKEAYQLTPRTIQRIIKKYAKSTGLNQSLTPQSLRDAHATELFSRGVDINTVQSQLGYTSKEVTKQYARRIKQS